MRARTPAAMSALGLALVLTLAACAAPVGPEAAPVHDTPAAATSDDGAALLADLGFSGMDGQEIVDQLESSEQARPLGLTASVREDHLLVGDGTRETAVPLPADGFYVSVAPFLEQTHECFYHSLATCRGELAGEEVSVVVTGDDGEVLVDESVTTNANGFTGFWLPRGIRSGRIEVSLDGQEGSVPFATTPGSPTCVTTLQLGPAGA